MTGRYYTYLVGWSFLNLYYYGSRTSRKTKGPTELMVGYKTSSKIVAGLMRVYGAPDVVVIRRTFESPVKCFEWEKKVLRRIDAKNHPLMLNQHNNVGTNPIHSAEVISKSMRGWMVAKDSEGNKFRVHKNDPRLKSGELVHHSKGMVSVVDDAGNNHYVATDNELYQSGELKSVLVGRMCGESNPFYGKTHDKETLARAVRTRRENGSYIGRVNSDAERAALSVRMKANNPMKSPEVKSGMKERWANKKGFASYEEFKRTATRLFEEGASKREICQTMKIDKSTLTFLERRTEECPL